MGWRRTDITADFCAKKSLSLNNIFDVIDAPKVPKVGMEVVFLFWKGSNRDEEGKDPLDRGALRRIS